MRFERLQPRESDQQLGQLCARSARAAFALTKDVQITNVQEILDLGFQLARDDQRTQSLLQTVPQRNPRSVWWQAHGNAAQGGEKVAMVYTDGDWWILTELQFAVFQAVDGRKTVAQILKEVKTQDQAAALIQVVEILGNAGSTLPLTHGRPAADVDQRCD